MQIVIPRPIKKLTSEYVKVFKEAPEAMAISYACIIAGTIGLYISNLEYRKQFKRCEIFVNDLVMDIEATKSYNEGYEDGINDIQKIRLDNSDTNNYKRYYAN